MMFKNIITRNNDVCTKTINGKIEIWDPFHSKIAAGIKKGIKLPDIKDDAIILYLGAAEGYTISHISNLCRNETIIGLDISPISMQKLYILAKDRNNLVPILADANKPEEYKELIDCKVDLIIQDIAQKNQAEILIKNSLHFLKKDGWIILSLKLPAISQNSRGIVDVQMELLKKHFKIIDQRRLEPFEKKHVLIVGQMK